MDIIRKYQLSDFTRDQYVKLIRLAKEKYRFRTISNFRKTENFVIWRHDVDINVTLAREIAELDAKEKIKSTFFILLHSELYNLLEKRDSGEVSRIIDLGHEIGLHFDANFYKPLDEKKLTSLLTLEKNFLEKIFKVKITSFAFHNPDNDCLKFKKMRYGGMLNAYSQYFVDKTGYCSDSNGYWRHKRLKDVLKSGEFIRLQVLTHPIYWQKKTGYPKYKIWSSVLDNADKAINWWDELLVSCERTNIGELNEIFDYLKSLDYRSGFELEKLWVKNDYEPAFLNLWRLQQKLINLFLKEYLEVELMKSIKDVEFFYKNSLKLDPYKRFEIITNLSFARTFGIKYSDYKKLILLKDNILNSTGFYKIKDVKNGFFSLARFLVKLGSVIRK